MSMLSTIHKLASPKLFYRTAEKFYPWISVICIVSLLIGWGSGLLMAPPDYQQGDAFRIIYVHVPSAFMSLAIYAVIAVMSVIALVWRIKLADVIVEVSTPLGALFTFIALITGALWGKPMWGTWWIWDARLTSELILLFLYLGIIGLRLSIEDRDKVLKISAIMVLVGFVDIPIIHYSVFWWNTLHQKATLLKLAKPSMPMSMFLPLIITIIGFLAYYIMMVLLKARHELLEREDRTMWVKGLSQ